jgi:serine protease Do
MKIFVLIILLALINFSCGRRRESSVSRNENPKIDHSSNNDERETRGDRPVIDKPIEVNTPPNNSSQKSVQELFKTLEKGVFQVYALNQDGSGSTGSGFFINSSGVGVTNYHVLDGHEYYEIKTSDGNYYEIVDILSKSPPEELDYVIFQVESRGKHFTSVPLANGKSEIGEDVFAIGSPLGYENSLTKGSVSQYRTLFNMDGEVIGITSAGVDGVAINFAIDIRAISYLKRY